MENFRKHNIFLRVFTKLTLASPPGKRFMNNLLLFIFWAFIETNYNLKRYKIVIP